MDLSKLIDKLSNKVSKKYLIIIIIVLSILIIGLLTMYVIRENKFFSLDTTAIPPQDTAGVKGPTVILDPGHGGKEPGAQNGNVFERGITLSLSLEVAKELESKKIDYYMIRNDDTYVSLKDRVRIANEKACKLFVSIHNNSFTDPSQGGILTAYNPYSPSGKKIAEIMQSKLSDIGLKNRSIMPRPNLYVLRYTDMPSILLEIGFISNKSDLKLITDQSFQKKCAKQIVSGIEDILKTSNTDGAENP